MRAVKRRDGRLTEEILMLEEREREGSFHVRAVVIEKVVPSKLLDCYCLVCKGMLLSNRPLARYSIENGAI